MKELKRNFYRISDLIERCNLAIKCFFQRGVKGFAKCDIWSFDSYLSSVISRGTKELEKELHGSPPDLTLRQWKKILKQISEGFELINRYCLTTVEEYEKNKSIYKKNRKRYKLPTKRNIVKMNKAFDLFREHFNHLWD